MCDGDDYTYHAPIKSPAPVKRCENCRLQSKLLSNKREELWCVLTSKHVCLEHTCEEHKNYSIVGGKIKFDKETT
jgi:hypothetical protein